MSGFYRYLKHVMSTTNAHYMWITDEWIPPVLEACQYWNGNLKEGKGYYQISNKLFLSLVSVIAVLLLLVNRDRFFCDIIQSPGGNYYRILLARGLFDFL